MIIKQKIIQYLKLKLITFRWILLLMLAVVLAYTQNSLADDAQEDSLEDEAQYEILEANQLEQAIQQETGHRLSDNTDLTKIKHGMLTKSGDSHYIWYATKDGQEHILRVDKNIQQNKQSPPIVKKVQSSDMSDLDHFVLQKKVELGLKNKNHSTNTKINESWQSRILNDITTYTNQGVSWGDWWNNISSGTLPPNEVRKEYNSRMTQTSNHLQQHIDAIGGLENLKPETARMYQNIRREIGKVLKSASSETEQKSIYKRNELKYGDKYGPTYKYLKDTKGYSHQEIAVKSIGTEGIMFGVVPLANNKNEPSVKKLFTLLDTFKSTQKPTTPAPKSTTVPTLDPTAAPTLE
ncbi:MAG: hypothetical protein HRU36_02875, partial [Rickettsiales bacterium]|nr:hypothetical protein [Rickettsiales bacterium]